MKKSTSDQLKTFCDQEAISFSLNSDYETHEQRFWWQNAELKEKKWNKFLEKNYITLIILKVFETRNWSLRHTINIFKLGVHSFEEKPLTTDDVAANRFQTPNVNSALCSTEKKLHRQGFLPCTQTACSLYSAVYCIFCSSLSSCEAKCRSFTHFFEMLQHNVNINLFILKIL